MKKKTIAVSAILAALFGFFHRGHKGIVLEAQTLPQGIHVLWTPDVASQNVVQYQVTLDAAAPVVVPASTCPSTATQCSLAMSVATAGAHTVSIVAQNLALSTDPTSLLSSPAASVSFTVNLTAPSSVGGATVTK